MTGASDLDSAKTIKAEFIIACIPFSSIIGAVDMTTLSCLLDFLKIGSIEKFTLCILMISGVTYFPSACRPSIR